MPLEGETTRLRALELDDVDREFAWVNDREVVEHLNLVYPMSRATEQEWAERASRYKTYGHAMFAIEIAETGEHIGNCGLHNADPVHRTAELGVLIGAKEHWGRGYGFDALRTLITFGFRGMNLRRIWLRVDENHPRGVSLYERLGFKREGALRGAHWSLGRPVDDRTMGILREESDAQYGAYEEVGDVPAG
jgi:RimJ/RimL family protein N-acetyltransferase